MSGVWSVVPATVDTCELKVEVSVSWPISFALPAEVSTTGFLIAIAPSATLSTVPPAGRFVNAEPSTAGNLEFPSNCTALLADVPAVNIEALPNPNVVLCAAASASSNKALPAAVKS